MQPQQFVIEVKSKTLDRFMRNLDNHLTGMEETIDALEVDRDKWRGDFMALQHQQLEAGNKMIANSLLACIDTPPLDAFSPASAIVICKIREMNNIQQVHEYIDTIKEKIKPIPSE